MIISSIERELKTVDRFDPEWLKSSFPIPVGTKDSEGMLLLTEEQIAEIAKPGSRQRATYAINCKALLEKENFLFPEGYMLELLKISLNAFVKHIPSVALLIRKLEGDEDESRSLHRFLSAQDKEVDGYADALLQVRSGRKTTHWIWYIFPQMRGLGYSETSKFYGIRGREEAMAYIQHPILRARLIEISEAVMSCPNSVRQIFGPDHVKVHSCMELFSSVSDIEVFKRMLSKKEW